VLDSFGLAPKTLVVTLALALVLARDLGKPLWRQHLLDVDDGGDDAHGGALAAHCLTFCGGCRQKQLVSVQP